MWFKLLVILLLIVALGNIASSEEDVYTGLSGQRHHQLPGLTGQRSIYPEIYVDPKFTGYANYDSYSGGNFRENPYENGIILSSVSENERLLKEYLKRPGREQSKVGEFVAALSENNIGNVKTKSESQTSSDSDKRLKESHLEKPKELPQSDSAQEEGNRQIGVKENVGNISNVVENTRITEEEPNAMDGRKGSDKSRKRLKENQPESQNDLNQTNIVEGEDSTSTEENSGSENISKVKEITSEEGQRGTDDGEESVQQQHQQSTGSDEAKVNGVRRVKKCSKKKRNSSSSSSEEESAEIKKMENDNDSTDKDKMKNQKTRTSEERIKVDVQKEEGAEDNQMNVIETNAGGQPENESESGGDQKVEHEIKTGTQPEESGTGTGPSSSTTSLTSFQYDEETSNNIQEEHITKKTEESQQEILEPENHDNTTTDVAVIRAPNVSGEESGLNPTDGRNVVVIQVNEKEEEGEDSMQADEGIMLNGTNESEVNSSRIENPGITAEVIPLVDGSKVPAEEVPEVHEEVVLYQSDLDGFKMEENIKKEESERNKTEGAVEENKDTADSDNESGANKKEEKKEKENETEESGYKDNPLKLLKEYCKLNYPATYVLMVLRPINININIINLDMKDLMLSLNENPKSEAKKTFTKVVENATMYSVEDNSSSVGLVVNDLPNSIQSKMGRGFKKKYKKKKHGKKGGKKYYGKKKGKFGGKSPGIYKKSGIQDSNSESHYRPSIEANNWSNLDQMKYVILDQDQANDVDQKMYMLVPVRLQKEEYTPFKVVSVKLEQVLEDDFDATTQMSKFQLFTLDENELKVVDQKMFKLVPVPFQEEQEEPPQPFNMVYVPPEQVLEDHSDEPSQSEENESTGIVKYSLIEKNIDGTVNEIREYYFPEDNGLTDEHRTVYYVRPEELENQAGPDFERNNLPYLPYGLTGIMFDKEGNFQPNAIEILKRLGSNSLDNQSPKDYVLVTAPEEETNSIGLHKMQYNLLEHYPGNEITDSSRLQRNIPYITSNIVYTLNSITGKTFSQYSKREESSSDTDNLNYIVLDGKYIVDEELPNDDSITEEQTQSSFLIETPSVTPNQSPSNEIRYPLPDKTQFDYKEPAAKDYNNLEPLPYIHHRMGIPRYHTDHSWYRDLSQESLEASNEVQNAIYLPPERISRYRLDYSLNSDQSQESLEDSNDVENAIYPPPQIIPRYRVDHSLNSNQYEESLVSASDEENALIVKPNSWRTFNDGIKGEKLARLDDGHSNSIENLQRESRSSYDNVLETAPEEETNSIGLHKMQYHLVEHYPGNEITDSSRLQRNIPYITSNIMYTLNSITGKTFSQYSKREESSSDTDNLNYIVLDGKYIVDEELPNDDSTTEEQTQSSFLIETPSVTPNQSPSNEIRYPLPDKTQFGYKEPAAKDYNNLEPLPYIHHRMGIPRYHTDHSWYRDLSQESLEASNEVQNAIYLPPERISRYRLDYSLNSDQSQESLEDSNDVENAIYPPPQIIPRYRVDHSLNSNQYEESLVSASDEENALIVKPNSWRTFNDGIKGEKLARLDDGHSNSIENLQRESRSSYDNVLETAPEEETNSIGLHKMQYHLVEHYPGNEITDFSGLQQNIPYITSNIVYTPNSITGKTFSVYSKREESSSDTDNRHNIVLDGKYIVEGESPLIEELPNDYSTTEEQTQPNFVIETPSVTPNQLPSHEIRYLPPDKTQSDYKSPAEKDYNNLESLPYIHHRRMGMPRYHIDHSRYRGPSQESLEAFNDVENAIYLPPEIISLYRIDHSLNSDQFQESLVSASDENALIVKPNSWRTFSDGYYGIIGEKLASLDDGRSNSIENLQRESRISYDTPTDYDETSSEENKYGQGLGNYIVFTRDFSEPRRQ